jgi:hypothetical protein
MDNNNPQPIMEMDNDHNADEEEQRGNEYGLSDPNNVNLKSAAKSRRRKFESKGTPQVGRKK